MGNANLIGRLGLGWIISDKSVLANERLIDTGHEGGRDIPISTISSVPPGERTRTHSSRRSPHFGSGIARDKKRMWTYEKTPVS